MRRLYLMIISSVRGGAGSPSVISFKLRPAGTIEEEEEEGEEEATGEDLTFPTRTLLAQLERLEREAEE